MEMPVSPPLLKAKQELGLGVGDRSYFARMNEIQTQWQLSSFRPYPQSV